MQNKYKHTPWYMLTLGLLSFSIGINVLFYLEMKLLQQEKSTYKVFFEYLYYKNKVLEDEVLELKYKDKKFTKLGRVKVSTPLSSTI